MYLFFFYGFLSVTKYSVFDDIVTQFDSICKRDDVAPTLINYTTAINLEVMRQLQRRRRPDSPLPPPLPR